MQNNSLLSHLKTIYCFTIKEPQWKEFEIKNHVQLSSNTIKLLMIVLSLASIISGKGLLNACLILVVFSFLLIVTNEKTLTAMKFFTMALSFGIPWIWIFVVGKESILFNQVSNIFAPVTVLVFTGSYTLTSVSSLYTIIFWKYSTEYIIKEFEQSPAAFEKMFYFYINNSYVGYLLAWTFLSFMFYNKQALFAQLWFKQKETEELFKQVQKKNEELEKVNYSRNRFFLSLSHEFRNPINAALGNLELAMEKITDTTVQKYITNSRTSIGLLFHLVSNLLDAHKIEAGALEWNEFQQDTRKIFTKVWNISRKLLDKNNLTGEFYIHKNIPKMMICDSHYLIQGLLNIVFNAIKYTQKGGVMVVLSWLPRKGALEDHLKPTEAFYSRFQSTITASKIAQSTELLNLNIAHKYHSEPVQYSCSIGDLDTPSIPLEYSNNSESALLQDKLLIRSSIELVESFRQIGKNYVKFTNRFESVKSFAENEGSLEELHKENNGYLKIEVFDSGRGIDDNIKSNLFEKYSSSSLNGEGRLGLGLGLWTTKSISEERGGQIRAFSEKDKGSQFIWIIPMSSGAPVCNQACARLRKMSASEALPKLSAFIVDDDKYNREISSVFLTKVGVSVKGEAVNGQEAVDVIISKPSNYCDFILMDLEMPVMGGKEAVKTIRQFEAANQRVPTKIVIATGNVDLEEYTTCMDPNGEVKADLFYRKPLKKRDFEEIAEIIQKEKFQLSTCIVINGDGLMTETLQISLKRHKVHTFALNSLEKAESYLKEYQTNLRWVLVHANEPKENISYLLKLISGLGVRFKPEVILFSDSFDSQQKTYFEAMGIEKMVTTPLNPDEVETILSLQ